MPSPGKSKKKSKGVSKTGNTTTVSKNSRSNDKTNVPASPVSDPFKDPDPSTGPLPGSDLFEHEGTGDKGCSKHDGSEAQQDLWELDSSGAPVIKSGTTMNLWTAIVQLRATMVALETVNRECIARCHDLEKNGEMDAKKLNVLEELVAFLAFKMDAHLEVVNHIRVLGHRPTVTAEDLYRAGLWPHDLSPGTSGNDNEQPSPADLPNTAEDQEPSPPSQTSHLQRDNTVAPMSSSCDQSTALTKTESATKIPIASLLNDGPPSRQQGYSTPSQNCDAGRVKIELPTAEDHNNLLTEIGKLKQQTCDLCLKAANCDDFSGKLTNALTDRSGSIASTERRVGLMYLVNRLHVGDQRAPSDVRDVPIGNEISNTCEGSCVKALMDAVLLDTTNLANDNDTRITSLDNVSNSQLDGKLTREGSSINGPQGGLAARRVEEISTVNQNVSQDQRLDEEEGKNSCGSPRNLSEQKAETGMNKSVHKVIEGQKLQKAEHSQKAESQQDEIEELARLHDEILLLQNVVGEASENGKNGSSEKRAFASAAEAFLRNLADSLTEQDKENGGEMLDALMKENADLTEKMKILASVDLLIEDSRLKMRVMQDAVGSQLDQISSLANGMSTGKVLVEDAKPDRESIKVDENKRSDSKEEIRPQDLADRIEISPSHGIGRYPNLIEEGNTASGGLQHRIDASMINLNLKPDPAEMPSGLLAREDAAIVLASIKTQRENEPLPVDSIEDQQPKIDDVHGKSTWQNLKSIHTCTSQSQSEEQNGDSGLQREIFKTKSQEEFKCAVMEDFHDVVFLSQSKDRPQPVLDRPEPAHLDVAEDEGHVKGDRERKHDGQSRKVDTSTQLGTNTTAGMPLRLNGKPRDSDLITTDDSGKCNESCQLKDVTNDTTAAESATSSDIIKLTTQSKIFKTREASAVNANSPQEKPSCPQSSSTVAKAREASDEEYLADSEWEPKVGRKTATLHVPQEVEYEYYGCDHPFL